MIEFSKDAKRIVVSHSRIHEDESNADKIEESNKAKAEAKETKKVVKKLKETAEKTTFGDISELANLKTALEDKEKKN